MRGKWSKNWSKSVIALSLAMGVASTTHALKADAAEGDLNLTVIYTNDTHAQLNAAPKAHTVIKEIRKANGDSLLVNAGDVFSGSLYFNLFEGEADLALMNLIGYDAMTFGNHEFDLGSSEAGHQSLAEFIGNAKFPLVSSNVDFSKDPLFTGLQNKVYTEEFTNGQVFNGIIKTINGQKVGIFGLTTEETNVSSSPKKVEISNYINAAKNAVAAFEKAGVNKIIALSHLGYDDSADFDNDKLLVQNVPGIDVIVGGHTHTALSEPVKVNDTVIVQSGYYLNNVGELDVTFDAAGKVTSSAVTLHPTKDATEDTAAVELLAPYKEQVTKYQLESVGATAAVKLNGERADVRTKETNLGNLITDGMLQTAKAIDPTTQFAFTNGGGIRASLEEGDITVGEIMTVMPFGNTLGIMNLKGSEIKAMLEHSLKDYPNQFGGFLHFSGLTFVFDASKPAGSRVVSVEINGKKVQDDQLYKAATNTFTAAGGDGFAMLKTAYDEGRITLPGNVDYEMFTQYLQSLKTVSATTENRIVAGTPFKDVKVTSEFHNAIRDLYYAGIIKGTSADQFTPNKALTRAQAASLIVRALGLTEKSTSPFVDIAKLDAKVQDEIAVAYTAGIIKGGDTFNPNASVSRAQLALMLARAYEKVTSTQLADAGAVSFKDIAKLDAETKKAVSFMKEQGIINGANNQFMPSKSATRAHAAKMLANLLALIPVKEEPTK